MIKAKDSTKFAPKRLKPSRLSILLQYHWGTNVALMWYHLGTTGVPLGCYCGTTVILLGYHWSKTGVLFSAGVQLGHCLPPPNLATLNNQILFFFAFRKKSIKDENKNCARLVRYHGRTRDFQLSNSTFLVSFRAADL